MFPLVILLSQLYLNWNKNQIPTRCQDLILSITLAGKRTDSLDWLQYQFGPQTNTEALSKTDQLSLTCQTAYISVDFQ